MRERSDWESFETQGAVSWPPDADLLRIIDDFDRVSCGLVLLEPYGIEEVAVAIRRLCAAVEIHVENRRKNGGVEAGCSVHTSDRSEELEDDHARFQASLAELAALLEIISQDDHGGNRQALGQYGKILSEALRKHLRAEDAQATLNLEKLDESATSESVRPSQRR
jgi:hypothetical protein